MKREKKEWRKSRKQTIFGYPCLEHVDNQNSGTGLPEEHETMIFGKSGYLYPFDTETFCVVTSSWFVFKKLSSLAIEKSIAPKRCEETVLRLEKCRLNEALIAIKAPFDSGRQLRYALRQKTNSD